MKRLDEIVDDVGASSWWTRSAARASATSSATIASLHPLRVLAHILGVPREDEPFILKLTNELFGAEDPEFQRGEMQTPSSAKPRCAHSAWISSTTSAR